MAILSELYDADPEQFERIESVKGRKRTYFSKSSLVIEASGNSVNPEKIPDTPYYAATNLSDEIKKRILIDVLKVLGIHGDRRTEYLSRLDPGHEGSGQYLREDDLDDLI